MYEIVIMLVVVMVFAIGIGVVIYAIAEAIRTQRYIKNVYPFVIDGNKGRRKSRLERWLDACDIADECKRRL